MKSKIALAMLFALNSVVLPASAAKDRSSGSSHSSSSRSTSQSSSQSESRRDRQESRSSRAEEKRESKREETRSSRAEEKRESKREEKRTSRAEERRNDSRTESRAEKREEKRKTETERRTEKYENKRDELKSYSKANPKVERTNDGREKKTYLDNKGRPVVQESQRDGSVKTTVEHKGGTGRTTSVTDANGNKQQEQVRRLKNGAEAKTVSQYNARTGERVTLHPNGAKTVVNADKSTLHTKADGTSVYRSASGDVVYKDRTGRNVYSEKSVVGAGGRTTIQRTTIINNRTYVSNYYSYGYGGYYYHSYVPFYYYTPNYYRYIYSPWSTPLVYSWDPYVYNYSWYFTPYSSYCGPTCWITDYMIIASLSANASQQYTSSANDIDTSGLQNGESKTCTTSDSWGGGQTCTVSKAGAVAAAPAKDNTPAAITPEIKEQYKAQVVLAAQASESKSGLTLEKAFQDPKYIFHVNQEVGVAVVGAAEGEDQKCTLGDGDFLRKASDQSAGDNSSLFVMDVIAAKGDGCDVGDKVLVSAQGLQDMQNAFMEKFEKANQAMQENKDKLQGAQVPDSGAQITASEQK